AIAHAELDLGVVGREPELLDPLSEIALEQRLLTLAVDEQRRTVLGPDRRVLPRRLRRSRAKDHTVQQRDPYRARDFDNPRVGQEFGEVGAHGWGRRRVRGAEVDQ